MTENKTKFAYSIEDETVAGDLDQYANDYANAHYMGISISRKGVILNTEGDPLPVEITTRSRNGDNDWIYVTFVANFPNGPEATSVRIDGRA